MGNMEYCRFRNTLKDLRDCKQYLNDDLNSEEEIIARKKLICLCVEIAQDAQEDLEKDV